MTRTTYERLRDEFECEPGGIIPVKGKGDTEVWFLVRERAAALDNAAPAAADSVPA